MPVFTPKKKNGKPYKLIKFETFEECEKYWIDFFLYNKDYKTKIVGTTIIAFPTNEENE